MSVECANPSFPRAIPHDTVIIDYLTKGVLFGSLRVLPRGGGPESLRGRFRGVSESTFSGVETRTCIRNRSQPLAALTQTRPRTWTHTCIGPRPWIPSLAELPLHFFPGLRKQVTEARTVAVRAGVVAKPSPLGDERGSVREIGLWIRMAATLHFLGLTPTARWLLAYSSMWPFWVPNSSL